MSGLIFLIPIAVAMGLGALVVFLWALRSGQYEDLQGASERIFEEDVPEAADVSPPVDRGR
jgi:cbb3-type cytochrome oxidase maturation protein